MAAAYPIQTSSTLGPLGVMHSFPVSERKIERRTPRYFSEVQALDAEGAGRMLEVTRDLVGRSKSLVDYVDRNRREARMSGIETIAIELSAILEGGRLLSMEDALEDAIRTGKRPEITIDGFSKLRRTEYLVGEIDHAIESYVKTPVGERGLGLRVPMQVGAGATLSDIPTSLLILGVIGAGAILTVVILAIMKVSEKKQ